MDSQRARDDLDDFMDTIDLTLSSPEPESRPPPKTKAPVPGGLSRPSPRPAQRVSSSQAQSQVSSQHLRPSPSQQRSSQLPTSSRHPPVHVRTPINPHSSIQFGSGYNVQRPGGNRTQTPTHQNTQQSRSTPSRSNFSHHQVHGRSTPSQSTTAAPPRNETRHVNLQHLSRIIDSTDPLTLRSVVLNLCKTSPALAGALARGLAPYSVFAQAIIKNQQRGSAQTHAGTASHGGSRTESYGAARTGGYDAVGMGSSRPQSTATRLQTTGVNTEGGSMPRSSSTQFTATRTPTASVKTEREHAIGGTSSSRPGQISTPARVLSPPRRRSVESHVSTPYATHSVKEEREGSPTDSDNSDHIVSLDSSRPSSRPQEPRTPLKSSPPKANHNVAAVNHSASMGQCIRCKGPFVPGPDKCVYHPGKAEKLQGKDIPMYICCNQPLSSRGCTAAPHMSRQFVAAPPFDGYHFLPQPDERSNKRRRV